MDMHNVRWPGWQAVRPLGGGAAGEVFEIQHHSPAGIESGALKVMQLPRDPGVIQQMLEGSDLETVKHRFHARMEAAAGAYGLMAALRGHPNVLSCEEPSVQPMADGIGWELTVKSEILQSASVMFAQGAAPEQVAHLGADMATALALCQERGVVHEGVKLSNIFVGDQGFKLGDFGAAKTTGMPCGGDLRCMSPEIYWGMGYDGRSDVYALGVLLYTLLNGGCLPLTAPGADAQMVNDACTRRLSGEALPLPAGGDPRLQQIIMRACAYEPAKRHGSALELRGELLAYLGMDPAAPLWPAQTAPVQSVPVPRPEPTWQPDPAPAPQPEQPAKKKNNSTLFLILAVAAAILVVGVVCFFTVHIWSEASCNEVPQCVICGKTGGKAQDHQWVEASCTQPETCSLCGETKGEALGHQMSEATKDTASVCKVCGMTDGKVLQPTLWVLKLISSGWQGSHKQTLEGSTVTLSFPEDSSFAQSQLSFMTSDGKAADGAFTAQWNEGVVGLTPAEGLEPGVYQVQLRTQDAGAMLTLCWGYAGETYLSSAEHFWSGNTWRSAAHGTYLTLEGGSVTATDIVSQATVFDSGREMIGVSKDGAGAPQPVVEEPVVLETTIYARDGQEGLVAFAYEGWYLACDADGAVYMTQQLDENCFWVAGR